MTTITLKQNEVTTFVQEYVIEQVKEHNEDFISFIEDTIFSAMMQNEKDLETENSFVDRKKVFAILEN